MKILEWMVEDGYITRADIPNKERSVTARLSDDQNGLHGAVHGAVLFERRRVATNPQTGKKSSEYKLLHTLLCKQCRKFEENEQTGKFYVCSNDSCGERWHAHCLPLTALSTNGDAPNESDWHCPKCAHQGVILVPRKLSRKCTVCRF